MTNNLYTPEDDVDVLDDSLGLDMSEWNDDIHEDISPQYGRSLVMNSRDWTVATIVDQIEQRNINLDPKFQRRNAWDDKRRSRLIESLLLGVPIPEIMLAEHHTMRGAFLVIDGKQRLLTLAGFINPFANPHAWDNPQIKGLEVLKDLNGSTFEDIQRDQDYMRVLINSSIRCSVISNYQSNDVLYDIFYRLNTGSVPLSTQELRQALNPGIFAEYLITQTNEPGQPIHTVLGLRNPDNRLRDIELILRFISLKLFGNQYRSNLKRFLDEAMHVLTRDWERYEQRVRDLYSRYNQSLKLLIDVFGGYKKVGRKLTNGKWETRFNKVLLEVEAYYFLDLLDIEITDVARTEFMKEFESLCADSDFRSSIESSTKNNSEYIKRFRLFGSLIKKVFGVEISPVPINEA